MGSSDLSLILAQRLDQDYCEFQDSLKYNVRLCLKSKYISKIEIKSSK